MTKQEWRRGDALGEIEGQFEGEWIHLANVGGTCWAYPNDGKNVRYDEWSDEALVLMLRAPELLEALEVAEIADLLSDPDHDPREAIKLMEARGDYETGWLDNDVAAEYYQGLATRKRQAVIARVKGQG